SPRNFVPVSSPGCPALSTCQWKSHVEHAALAQRALNTDRSAQKRQQLTRHAEAQSGASCAARGVLFDLAERFEDVIEMFGRDADAGVSYVDHEIIAGSLRGHRDLSALGELDGVRQQIHEHLLELHAVRRRRQVAVAERRDGLDDYG